MADIEALEDLINALEKRKNFLIDFTETYHDSDILIERMAKLAELNNTISLIKDKITELESESYEN